MFFDSIGYDESIVEPPYVMEGIKGKPAEKKELYDLEMRRKIDAVLTERSCEFIKRNANKKPFFLYVPLTQLHFPTLPHREFEGASKHGDFADSLIEMDARVGQIIDAVDQNNLSENTIFIFASDNGPEYRRPWRGSAGMWTGTYHTAMEGALRVPLIIRWPNKIPAGKVTNEMIHVVDLFPTLAQLANLEVPKDRIIDGLDQSQFLIGKQEKSNREGFVYFIKTELRAAKWRDWKMHFVWEIEPNAGANHLETPYLFNIVQDPKEESDVNSTQGWVRGPIRKMIINFQSSLKEHPAIPPGAPDDFQPK
jgi:arylsulfatase